MTHKKKFHLPVSRLWSPVSGFLIIEVVVALALFLVTLTVFGVAVSTIPLTKTASDQNLAYHIAAKKIETLRHTAYASLPAVGTSSFTDSGFSNLNSATGQVVVATYGSASAKKITVTVSWQDAGKARSVVIETLMSNAGLNQ